MKEKQLIKLYHTLQKKYPLLSEQLKEHQKTVILNIVNGKHSFTILRTGYGKTLTFILPPLILNEVIRYCDYKY